jgi:hypothetical protein
MSLLLLPLQKPVSIAEVLLLCLTNLSRTRILVLTTLPPLPDNHPSKNAAFTDYWYTNHASFLLDGNLLIFMNIRFI